MPDRDERQSEVERLAGTMNEGLDMLCDVIGWLLRAIGSLCLGCFVFVVVLAIVCDLWASLESWSGSGSDFVLAAAIVCLIVGFWPRRKGDG
jgi:hypothetical protein